MTDPALDMSASELTPWSAAFVALDVETTGLAHDSDDRVVEIAAVRFENRRPVATMTSRINPGRPIPPEITALHGVSDADVADSPSFAEFLPRITDLCEGAFYTVAYNADFDRAFARAEAKRAASEVRPFGLRRPWVDPFRWVQRLDRFVPGKGRHRLETTCARRGVALTKAHSADADALAAGLLWLQLEREVRTFLGTEPATINNVLRAQALIAAEEEARFQEWKAKQPPTS